MKRFFAALFMLGLFLLPLSSTMAERAVNPAVNTSDSKPLAMVVKIDGVISPATYDLIHRRLETAKTRKASVIVLEMHTPGGLVDSMQQIIQDILDSEVPVVTYVSPPGSHAASAGTYILYGSHIAAMAPGTNIGAATPIQMGGNDGEQKSTPDNASPDKNDTKENDDAPAPQSTLEHKMVNDAAAYIRGLAELRGRNAEWAEKAVRDASSMTASEALSSKVIDLIADDIPQLLQKIDGKTVKMSHGKTMKLVTKDAVIEYQENDWRHKLLEIITHPNVALLLMSLGSYGIIYEFSAPGTILPGLIGAIFLLLGLYAMNILPINMTGLALIFIGIACMTAEAFTPTFGILGLGGAAAFAFGAAMLIDTDISGYGIDWWVIGLVTASSVGFLTIVIGLAIKAQRRPVTGGVNDVLDGIAEVLTWSHGNGEVRIAGEIWKATAAADLIIQQGDKVRVVAVDGLTLSVSPVQ